MRHLTTPSTSTVRRGSSVGLTTSTLSSPNQSRYKGLNSTPGHVKFSAWKRENEVPNMNFYEFIICKLESHDPEKIWIKDESSGRSLQFGKAKEEIRKLASSLVKLGFSKGDVLTMYCSNYVEYWSLALATWSCGGIFMPVNCELTRENLESQLRDAKTKILVCDEFNYVDAYDILDNTNIIEHLILIGTEERESNGRCRALSKLLEDDGSQAPGKISYNWESDVIYMPFTSTSSQAKGILHTNKSLMFQFYSPEGAANHWFDQLIGDTLLCGNHFFHMTGFYSLVLASVYGITLYCLSEYSDLSFLTSLVNTKTASVSCYAWQIRMLSQSPIVRNFDLSTLKILLTGCGLLSPIIRNDVMEKIPSIKMVREAYGVNECGLVCLTYPKEKKMKSGGSGTETSDETVVSLGLPNMFTMIKIISRQTGSPVDGPDVQGEICIKTPQSMLGYLGENPENAFDSEQYFHTGDLGYYDASGIIYFIERIENLINFWMYEVAPSIIESRLLCSNNIVDAAVVGISNKENGQVPRAFVVLKPEFEETEENLRNLMESRLQDHERIRGGLYFVMSIPRDENWKVLRQILVEYVPTQNDGSDTSNDEMSSSSKSSQLVQELEKQPNGSFVVPKMAEETSFNVRVKRGNKTNQMFESLANKLKSHPGVNDAAVLKVHIDGIGDVPRGFVTIKSGYDVSAKDILSQIHSSVSETEKLKGGLVLVDIIDRDSKGNILSNLEKQNSNVVGLELNKKNQS